MPLGFSSVLEAYSLWEEASKEDGSIRLPVNEVVRGSCWTQLHCYYCSNVRDL